MKIEKEFKLEILIPLAALLIITVLFWMLPLDILIQSAFYSADNGWFLNNSTPWKFLYHHGNLPALFLSVGSLILLGISFWNRSLIKFRKIFIYFVLVMAIGPGLLINSVLKDNWGRPRPRNIIEFDGKYNYEKPLEINLDSSGKSFPCGHASMGFYLMAPFFLLRKKKKSTAISFLFGGIILGGLIGFARIVQGGHFASDVIWSGAIVYLVSVGFYHLLRLDKKLYFIPKKEPASRQKVLIVSIIIFAVIALILLILMASPYSSEKTYDLNEFREFNKIYISIANADIKRIESEKNKIVLSAAGHGFPWSKLKTRLKQKDRNLILSQRVSGYFTEILQEISVLVPDSIKVDIKKT